jgi:hypothetical protein
MEQEMGPAIKLWVDDLLELVAFSVHPSTVQQMPELARHSHAAKRFRHLLLIWLPHQSGIWEQRHESLKQLAQAMQMLRGELERARADQRITTEFARNCTVAERAFGCTVEPKGKDVNVLQFFLIDPARIDQPDVGAKDIKRTFVIASPNDTAWFLYWHAVFGLVNRIFNNLPEAMGVSPAVYAETLKKSKDIITTRRAFVHALCRLLELFAEALSPS